MRREQTSSVDFAALFMAIPAPYLVLHPDLVIAVVNDAYLGVVQRRREDLEGWPVFEAFPPNPDDPNALVRLASVKASFERARDTARPDVMDVQKYDLADPATGQFEERFWSLVHLPVLDGDGRTRLIVQRTEDITERVRAKALELAAQEEGEAWRRRVEGAEADLANRAELVRSAQDAEDAAIARLAAMAGVTLQLAGAKDVEDLRAIVIDSGLTVLGADGGAVVVRTDGDTLQLTLTDTLGPTAQRLYAEVPLRSPLPAAVAAATGQRVLLRNRAEAVAFTQEMAQAVEATGCQAWACIPMRGGGRLLGSLAVGWTRHQDFGADDIELLEVFAAQCAQALDRIQVRQSEKAAAAAVARLSETLQRSLLSEPAQPQGLQIAVRYQPAAHDTKVGGDWYDAFRAADGSTLVVVGDVAGHDREAAATMAQVRNVLRGVAHNMVALPAAVLSALDRAMGDFMVGALATAVLVRFGSSVHGSAGLPIRWSNAGHPPPILLRADGSAELLATDPDLLLGLDPGAQRVDHSRLLAPGDTLLLYTDGLVERRGSSLDDGLEWLRSTLESLPAEPLDALCDAILAQLPGAVEDDVALIAVRTATTTVEQGDVPPGAGLPAPRATPDAAVHGRTTIRHEIIAVREARSFVRRHCQAAGVDPDMCEAAVLLTSEAVTNALVHGHSEARLDVVASRDSVRVEVGDDNSRHPARVERDDDALDGRGLSILELVAARWGVQDEPTGKVVWFEVSTAAAL